VASAATRTAGSLFAVTNNGVDRFRIGFDGEIYKNGSVFTGGGGGGSTGFITTTSSDHSNATQTAADIPEASFIAAANTRYIIRATLIFSTTTTSEILRLRVKAASAPTLSAMRLAMSGVFGTYAYQNFVTAYDTDQQFNSFAGINANQPYAIHVEGTLETGAAGGTFQLQSRNNIAGTTTIYKGSYLEWREF
jgi:hypothetical protein